MISNKSIRDDFTGKTKERKRVYQCPCPIYVLKIPWETAVKAQNFQQKECSRFVPQPEQKAGVRIKAVR